MAATSVSSSGWKRQLSRQHRRAKSDECRRPAGRVVVKIGDIIDDGNNGRNSNNRWMKKLQLLKTFVVFRCNLELLLTALANHVNNNNNNKVPDERIIIRHYLFSLSFSYHPRRRRRRRRRNSMTRQCSGIHSPSSPIRRQQVRDYQLPASITLPSSSSSCFSSLSRYSFCLRRMGRRGCHKRTHRNWYRYGQRMRHSPAGKQVEDSHSRNLVSLQPLDRDRKRS